MINAGWNDMSVKTTQVLLLRIRFFQIACHFILVLAKTYQRKALLIHVE